MSAPPLSIRPAPTVHPVHKVHFVHTVHHHPRPVESHTRLLSRPSQNPGGISASSRGLSTATPPETCSPVPPIPAGSQPQRGRLPDPAPSAKSRSPWPARSGALRWARLRGAEVCRNIRPHIPRCRHPALDDPGFSFPSPGRTPQCRQRAKPLVYERSPHRVPEGRSKSCSHQNETLQPRASVRLGAPLRDLANFDTLFWDSAPD